MAQEQEMPLDRLWSEYSLVFKDFDDLSLARWMAQTLGQLQGRAWRLSHPLIGAYRLATHIANDRQIWLKRLATVPAAYAESPCCRAPLLPLLTRDLLESGLICQHCSDTAVALDSLGDELQADLKEWAQEYSVIHAVAHQEKERYSNEAESERAFEEAARQAEQKLVDLGRRLAPKLLDLYPAVIWEDQDECLEVRPEDVSLS
jgi:hypothetical protein